MFVAPTSAPVVILSTHFDRSIDGNVVTVERYRTTDYRGGEVEVIDWYQNVTGYKKVPYYVFK